MVLCFLLALFIPALTMQAILAQAAPIVQVCLPERFRVLTDQQFDLRIEATGLTTTDAHLQVILDKVDITGLLPAPEVTVDNDKALSRNKLSISPTVYLKNPEKMDISEFKWTSYSWPKPKDPSSLDTAWTFRAIRLTAAGVKQLRVVVTDGAERGTTTARIGVQPFALRNKTNLLLFLGDAMGTAYRDAARIVAQSTDDRLREGFFDDLLQMDQMPITGMVLTHAMDRIVPDSANTATAWSTGNKTIDGALGVFPDNNDFRFDPSAPQATKQFALDNPRVETLWEYLKRRYGYKTGIVTTADVTDATPGGAGAHTITRDLGYEIAKQYVDGVFTSGPTFDVMMGGGRERFASRTAENSGDTRNLVAELQTRGYTYVQTRTELNALPEGPSVPDKVVGLFRTGNMNVAYDKLGLIRPADESPTEDLTAFPDQPFLDEMTTKALTILSKNGGPFILLVEGASIDKQSHANYAAGQIWDTIELDKAVGVGRAFLALQKDARTLVLVTADHDQSMSIIGLTDTSVSRAVENVQSNTAYPPNTEFLNVDYRSRYPGESDGFPDYEDTNGDGYPENTNRFRIAVGYRTGRHTGSAVPITAEGPGALLFTGYCDQTDLFFKMATVLSRDTSALDQALSALLEGQR